MKDMSQITSNTRMVTLNYLDPDTHAFVIKKNKWVIGIGSMKAIPNTKTVEIFHIYIDLDYRPQSLSKQILRYLESLAVKENDELMIARIMPKNIIANALLQSEGYIEKEKTGRKIKIFQKKIN